MKKTFTFFAIPALFLMLLFPVSVKAETTLSFIFEDPSGGKLDEDCNGNTINDWNAITTSDFHFSSKLYDEVKKQSSYLGKSWTSFKAGAKACTRHDVHLEAGSYTFTLKTTWMYGNNNTRVPIIRVNSQDYSLNNVNYPSNEEVDLEYTVSIPSTNDYPILITCVDGDVDKFCMRALTITPNCTQHSVTVAADNNKGTVTGGGSYCENSEVTVTATSNPGYNFVNWTDNNNSNAVVSTNASYTFTLTANVSYRANFAACEGAAVTVNVNDEDMGSATGGGSYCAGVQVDLEATPNSGYRFVNWTVPSGSASLDNVNNASAHFTMSNPAAAVTVQANFEVDPCTNSKTTQCESNYVVVTVHGNADDAATPDVQDGYVQTVDQDHWYAYYYPVTISSDLSSFNFNVQLARSSDNNSYINIFKKTNEGSGNVEYAGAYYNKLGWKKLATGSWNDNWFTVDVASFDDGGSGFSTLSAGEYLVALSGKYRVKLDYFTLTASENIFCPNTITMQKSGDASAADPTSSPANTAMAGVEVTVTAGAPSDANHYFSGWTASPSVTFADATALSTTFVMPAEDVTITANYGAIVSSALTFAAGEGGAVVSATAGGDPISSGDEVISGTSVTLTAGANSNYVFINWTDDNNSDAVVSTNAAFTFSMPAASTAYTAHFAQIDNVISQGSEPGSDKGNSGGGASIAESHIADFDAFGHNVVKLTYSNMSGSSAYCGWNIGKSGSYNSASSAGATGFGFYYKTEAADDAVAMWFDPNTGNDADQRGMQLAATENVWKYVYFEHAEANGWNHDNIIIYINGDQDEKTTAKASGAIYIADIAATSITSKPDIDTYTYTRANASNSYGTLCLPMAGSVSGATLYSVAGKQEEGGKLYIVLEEQGDALAAGEPYIFETDGSTLTATMRGPHSAVNAEAHGLVGTYQQITAPAYSEPDDLNYVLALDNSNNTVFMKVGEEVTVGAYRAYINIKNAGDYSPASAAPGRKYIRFGIEGTEEEQAVEMIYDDASLRTRKIMQNGHLYILRDGHLFTAQGTQIK